MESHLVPVPLISKVTQCIPAIRVTDGGVGSSRRCCWQCERNLHGASTSASLLVAWQAQQGGSGMELACVNGLGHGTIAWTWLGTLIGHLMITLCHYGVLRTADSLPIYLHCGNDLCTRPQTEIRTHLISVRRSSGAGLPVGSPRASGCELMPVLRAMEMRCCCRWVLWDAGCRLCVGRRLQGEPQDAATAAVACCGAGLMCCVQETNQHCATSWVSASKV